MKKLALLGLLALLASACDPSVPRSSPPELVTARFDPAANPPIVPTPTDLASSPATGLLNLAPPPGASKADQELIAYLNTLDGYPGDTLGIATFTGALDPASITSRSVAVLDITGLADGGTSVAVTHTSASYTVNPGNAAAPATLTLTPPGGAWTPGHTFAIALNGGTNGLKGAKGQSVVGSPTWALLKLKQSLVTCTDLTSKGCRAATDLIPSAAMDPAARLADQAAKAVKLEQIRRGYAPVLAAFESTGLQRSDIALMWTFRVTALPTMVFQPAASPPEVPAPNDLAIDPDAGLLNVPIDPNSPPAQQELTRDYLNHLDGFPTVSTGAASATSDLDPSSVSASTVKVLDVSPADGGAPPSPAISYDATARRIVVDPPDGGWQKGHTYALAVAGGASGVKGAHGETVVASDVWALARGTSTLVTCQDLSSPGCAPTVTLAPVTRDQAVQLEALRRRDAPLLDALAAQGLARADVAVMWTFTIVSQPEVTFDLDPADPAVPFPNDAFLAHLPDGGTQVSLPVPDGGSPQATALTLALNMLDGFSTTAPAISENSIERGALTGGTLDPSTLGGGAGLLNLDPAGPAPSVTVCDNCASSSLPDGGVPASPDQIQLVPQVPLRERSTYAAFLTTRIKDTSGRAAVPSLAFALIRLQNPLVDASGQSTVQGVSDAQAAALEPVRRAMQPLLAALEGAGISRSSLALAWAFTTQSTVSTLRALRQVPSQLSSSLPAAPLFLVDLTLPVEAAMGPLPSGNIGKIFAGEIRVPFMLTGPEGAFGPAQSALLERIPFTFIVPKSSAPASGYPITLFGHGLTRSRNDVLAIADSLAAAGFATIATDVVWHGDRSVCVGSHVALGTISDDAACARSRCDESPSSPTFGRCVSSGGAPCNPAVLGGVPPDLACAQLGQGACNESNADPAQWTCEGGDFARDATGTPRISGWNMLNLTNLFATRDNFRQQVVDLSQLVRVLSDPSGLNAQLAPADRIDPAHIQYAGQSLGGILGTLFAAVAPEVHHAALNVPGADLTAILLTSPNPSFTAARNGFLAALAAQGIVQGTPAFDSFISTGKWILDPADPANAAEALTRGTSLPPDRAVLVQFIQDDQVVPNPTTLELIADAQAASNPAFATQEVIPSSTDPTQPNGLDLNDRHAFLLSFVNPGITAKAQADVSGFLSTGTLPP